MAEPAFEARIRDLKRRLELDPTSRLFVSLAEEYRKAGRVADALITLQQGLRNHPGYVSAQVALGRAYLEAGNISEAIATFTKVLTVDPGNLVSAKSLADVYLSRGESLEAIKKYKLYRALSGDRTVDEIVERLEKEIAPPAPRPSRSGPAVLPAPPTFFEAPPPGGRERLSRGVEISKSPPGPVQRREDAHDVTSIKWEESTGGGKRQVEEALEAPTRAPAIDAAFLPAEAPAATPARQIPPAPLPAEPEASEPQRAPAPLDEVFVRQAVLPPAGGPPPAPAVTASDRPTDRVEPAAAGPGPTAASAGTSAEEPQGQTLADLYFAQGYYAEALRIYDELVVANPFDADLKRLRRDAEARLLPAGVTAGAVGGDPGLQRRLARIRTLKQWLSVVQAG